MRAALVAIEARTPLDARSLAVINAILAADEGTDRLEAHGDGYRIQRHHARDDATNALVPIARDVASLIVAPDAPRPPVRGRRVRPALLRRLTHGAPALVRDGDLWKSREGVRVHETATRDRMSAP